MSVEQLIQSVNISVEIRKFVRTKNRNVDQNTGFLLNDDIIVTLFDLLKATFWKQPFELTYASMQCLV